MPTKRSTARRRKATKRTRNPSRAKHRYEVIVGNVGTVYDGSGKVAAKTTYLRYVKVSLSGAGRAGGEGVVLMEDGEIIAEHYGEND